MIKRVGNHKKIIQNHFVLIFGLLFLTVEYLFCASESSIVLRMHDMNHQPIEQAMIQAPFILQVELKNVEGYNDSHLMQNIPGLDNFKFSQGMTSHNVSIDNGKKFVKTYYNYILRSDKKGDFKVGPVLLRDKTGRKIPSNSLVITVGDEIIETEHSQKDKYFMTMTLNKKQAYVGEKVGMTIKFYDRLFVDDLHLQFPDFKNILFFKGHDHIKKSMIDLEEEEYSLTEWNFDMYPKQVGTEVIQDIQAAFFTPEFESKFKQGGVFDFFRSLQKLEQYVVVKPVKLDVKALPQSKEYKDITAVGTFTQYRCMINQDVVSVGQGVILSLDLVGDGNFEMIPTPSLLLPQGFRYYDSNMVTIDEKRTMKHSEFVLQMDTAGSYVIPSQILQYFDPVSESYKQIMSNEITITVTPQEKNNKENKDTFDYQDSCQDDEKCQKTLQDFTILPIQSLAEKQELYIPIAWYHLLLLMIIDLWIFLLLYRYLIKNYLFELKWWKKFILFYRIKKRWYRAEKNNTMKAMFLVIEEMCAYLCKVAPGQFQRNMMIDYLESKHYSPQEICDWNNFYARLLHASFAGDQEKKQPELYQEGLAWIDFLKEKA